MTSALEQIDPTTVKLTVSISQEELAPALAHALEHIGEEVQIPGFRKGKVPAKLLEQRVGRGAVIEHAVNEQLPVWYSAAVEEHKLRPFGQPEIELVQIPVEDADVLEFTATVEVRPEVSLPSVEGLKIEVEPIEVSDSDVDERLTALQERFASLSTVDRPAENGDFVVIDLSAKLDGADVDAVQGTSYQIGSGNLLEGLDEAVTGLSAGEETTYEGPLAAGDHAGETATISVKVTAVKARELPEANDEFAELASEFDTIAELREDLREQVSRIKSNNQAIEARQKLLDTLIGSIEFELPKKVIENEVHSHLEGEGRLEDDTHRAEVTEEAETSLRSQIVLDQLADDLEITVEEGELLDYLLNASRQYGIDPGNFIQQVQQSGQIPSVVAEVARSKASAFALRRATIVDTAGKAVDLSAVIGTLEDEKKSEEEGTESE